MSKKNRHHINPKYVPKNHKRKLESNREHFYLGLQIVHQNKIFYEMLRPQYMQGSYRRFEPVEIDMQNKRCPENAWALVTKEGVIYPNLGRMADEKNWAYIIAHAMLHLALDHFQPKADPIAWNVACDYVVERLLRNFKIGTPPIKIADLHLPAKTEDALYTHFIEYGIPNEAFDLGMSEAYTCDLEFKTESRFQYCPTMPDYPDLFAKGLRHALKNTIATVSRLDVKADQQSLPQQCKQWFINNYPLLGSLATTFEIIEDPVACQALNITIAAVDISQKRIYFNPASYVSRMDDNWHVAGKRIESVEEMRFVMAHELLHVALRHQARSQGRDPFLWNVACDYVINQWLVEMQIGRMPEGLLYDESLKGLNAESIYDRIVNDMRRYRKLASLRGIGIGDMLGDVDAKWWAMGEGLSLDNFYRRILAEGFELHLRKARGFLPAGLIEEIRASMQPPVPWDVELGQWFDARFPPLEKRRTYARPSRRQASTPNIPRPSYHLYEADTQSRTFGVVLDTSGSMSTKLLAKALGSIASYSQARDVLAVRVIFCDAHPYDAGYMLPEDIAETVQVKGRGGTVLQPAIDLLERADDFPKSGPILVITDGYCDVLRVRRDHAYIIPLGHRLPFTPKGEVFFIN